jgi:hypothetical protein
VNARGCPALDVGYPALSIAPARSLGRIMDAHERMPDEEDTGDVHEYRR